MRVGNKINSGLNGEWAKHVRGWWKRYTSSKRRIEGKEEIADRLRELTASGFELETSETGDVGIRCNDCNLISYNISDISQRFCGNCDKFHSKK